MEAIVQETTEVKGTNGNVYRIKNEVNWYNHQSLQDLAVWGEIPKEQREAWIEKDYKKRIKENNLKDSKKSTPEEILKSIRELTPKRTIINRAEYYLKTLELFLVSWQRNNKPVKLTTDTLKTISRQDWELLDIAIGEVQKNSSPFRSNNTDESMGNN